MQGRAKRIAGENSPSVQQPVLGLKSYVLYRECAFVFHLNSTSPTHSRYNTYDLTQASACSSTFVESAKSAVCRLRVSVLNEAVGRKTRLFRDHFLRLASQFTRSVKGAA